jgi:hypothetical protein
LSGCIERRLNDVNTRTDRAALIVVGVIALIVGGVFVGQGANVIQGSVMTGSRTWFGIGWVGVAIGLALVVFGVWPRRSSRKKD